MNPLLISAGLKLLNTVIEKNKDGKEVVDDWKKEEIVEQMFTAVDEARPFWARKTFWATVVGVAVPILNKAMGLDMAIEEVSAAVLPLVAFIAGESWRKKG